MSLRLNFYFLVCVTMFHCFTTIALARLHMLVRVLVIDMQISMNFQYFEVKFVTFFSRLDQ